MESNDSSTAGGGGGGGGPKLPPGFRFHPTDEELVVHYLKRKAQSCPLPVAIIAEVDLYKFDPWELPAKAAFGEQEWYFFSPRERKYPNGARPNRSATSGYWKATGTDKPILSSGGTQKVGVKKALVFYGGKPPRGVKTNWIMHEYRLAGNKAVNKTPGYDPANKHGSLRLDDWVLCRIYKKNTHAPGHHEGEDFMDDGIPSPLDLKRRRLNYHHLAWSSVAASTYATPSQKMEAHHHEHNLFQQMQPSNATAAAAALSLPPLAGRPAATTVTTSPLNRTPPSLYWNEDNAAGTAATAADHDTGANSMASPLSQLQPAQSRAMVVQVPLGEGLFRQPYQRSGLNWYS